MDCDTTQKRRLVVLTGAGMSAESGLRTFRDSGGLWEEYDVMDVASIEGWYRNPELVMDFYNARREQLQHAEPNTGHHILARLEDAFDVRIITQNVDNLHERAGSTQVLHLHGELTKVQTVDGSHVQDVGYARVPYGTRATDGSHKLLRPFIVWFGEPVPNIVEGSRWVSEADILLVVGTSLSVYPAAGLVHDMPLSAHAFVVDPNEVDTPKNLDFQCVRAGASEGLEKLEPILRKLA